MALNSRQKSIDKKFKEILETENKLIEEQLNESISEFNTIPKHIIKDLKPLYHKTR